MKSYTNANKMPISVGIPLLLQISGNKKSYKACIVGFRNTEYIIIEMPRNYVFEQNVSGGSKIDGAMISSGLVVRFESHVISHLSKPFPLLIASFPQVTEQRNLRKSFRVECNIPATLKVVYDMSTHPGLIANISTGGCRYYSKHIPGNKSLSYLGTTVLIAFELSSSIGALTLQGEILSIDRDREGTFLGIKFCANSTEIIDKINTYLMDLVELLS